MAHRWIKAVAMVVAVAAAIGCGGDDDDDVAADGSGAQTSTTEAAATQAAAVEGADLAGRTFTSTEVTEGGEARPLVDDTAIVLSFDAEGTLGADAGCNSFGGDIDFEADGRMAVDDLVSTRLGCAADLMAQDEWLNGFLEAGPSATLDGDTLTLTSGDSDIVLTETPDATPGDGAADGEADARS